VVEIASRPPLFHKAVFVTLLGLMASESALVAYLAGTRSRVARAGAQMERSHALDLRRPRRVSSDGLHHALRSESGGEEAVPKVRLAPEVRACVLLTRAGALTLAGSAASDEHWREPKPWPQAQRQRDER
jgi:hypothetical protein